MASSRLVTVVEDVVQRDPEDAQQHSPRRRGSSATSSPATPRGRQPSRSATLPAMQSFAAASSLNKGKAPMRPGVPSPTAEGDDETEGDAEPAIDPYRSDFVRTASQFRSALEWDDPDQREKEQEAAEKKERARHRDSWRDLEAWRPKRWLSGFVEEIPALELQSSNGAPKDVQSATDPLPAAAAARPASPTAGPALGPDPSWLSRHRSLSLPHIKQAATPGWTRLKAMLQRHPSVTRRPRSVVPPAVNITDELIGGGLSTLMLRMWFERDERGERRVPVLLHRLRIRVSDSLHPLSGGKAVFRIECEYANGAVRWVVYRQLRDFYALHAHYRVSNVYNRNIDALPEFPKTSLPYFKFLKSEARNEGRVMERAEFARIQRQSLENYLVGLLRAVMFHSTANRLCRFLEISLLSITLAHSGGSQHKAGVLRIEAVGKTGAFSRKGLGWREKKKGRWCAVRESYLVAMESPGELEVHDVFLLDSSFIVERPTRYLRKGLHLLHITDEGKDDDGDPSDPITEVDRPGATVKSTRSPFSKIFHIGAARMSTGRRASEDSSSSSSSNSSESGRHTPLADPSTGLVAPPHRRSETPPLGFDPERAEADKKGKRKKHDKDLSQHVFYVQNAQMRLKVTARNERQMDQWIAALERAASTSHWTMGNRFDSFAPIRTNVQATWLVDGRDYFWSLSRAILLAKNRIYIMDWWLSPELHLRRPGREQYRLDRLLERKAKEGVQIFVILYNEVSNRTTPTDSFYAKSRLVGLHENIFVQRSPSHFQTGTFYWAHHEKLCVVDESVAFTGGYDLCFGRWDTPQHALADELVADGDSTNIWKGKDYSNPRIVDFHTLNKPEQEMYDRTKVPRMPWHDVGLQVVGQPARDLCRHFVGRWNYLLRVKSHSRSYPFILPPPEFKPAELTENQLTGTCEVQICRSAGPWSMGTPVKIEHSIQNAYLKAIQLSEHFVYIENQFFITSTVVEEVQIENRIGDALVERIIRAHDEGTPWRACIIIPLLPGFPFPVDHSDASALRMILQCQSRTISRGPNSIFARLRREGIEPDDYITFFSLRGWGKLSGETLTTEQIYIHAKILIADDRVVIIGSANINERSQRGDRDSELAAVIRDADMIDSTMAGEPFKVGRFAHALRIRLMREHLGVDVDALASEESMHAQAPTDTERPEDRLPEAAAPEIQLSVTAPESPGGNSSETDKSSPAKTELNAQSASTTPQGSADRAESPTKRSQRDSGSRHAQWGRHSPFRRRGNRPTPAPQVDVDGFADPISEYFYEDVWMAAAQHNTEIYRKVFHAIPDDTITSWKQYRDFVQHHERFLKPTRDRHTEALARLPTESGAERADGVAGDEGAAQDARAFKHELERSRPDLGTSDPSKPPDPTSPPPLLSPSTSRVGPEPRNRRPSRPDQPFEPWERDQMEETLDDLVGNLVVFPTKFLEGEDIANNFLFNTDRLLPLPIYT